MKIRSSSSSSCVVTALNLLVLHLYQKLQDFGQIFFEKTLAEVSLSYAAKGAV